MRRPAGHAALAAVAALTCLGWASAAGAITLEADPQQALTAVLEVPALPEGAAGTFVNWGDGRSQAVPIAARYPHRYLRAGSYQVRLVDGAHAALLFSGRVRVEAPGPAAAAGVPPIRNLQGYVAVDALTSFQQGGTVVYGNGEGALHGLSVSAEVALDAPDRHVVVSATDLTLDHQQVRLQLSRPEAALTLSLDAVPPIGSSGRRTTALAALSVTDPGLPRLDATAVSSTLEGSGGYHMSSVQLGASDRYARVLPGVGDLRWRTTFQTTASGASSGTVGGPAGDRSSDSLQAQLAAHLSPGGDGGWQLDPQIRSRLRWTQAAGTAGDFQQKHELRLDLKPDPLDDARLAASVTLDSAAAPANEQSLRLATGRLAPATLRADLTRSNDGAADSFDYGAGADVTVSDALQLNGGYRGGMGPSGGHNGFDAGLDLTLAPKPWTLGLAASGGVQLYADGHAVPTARARLRARFGTPEAHATANGALSYDGANLDANLDLDGGFTSGRVTVDASGGLQAVPTLSLRSDVTARLRLVSTLSLQSRFAFRATLGATAGSVTTFGLGLRYDFGGSR